MKKEIIRSGIVLITGLLLSFAPQARGDAEIIWDFDEGFSPNTVVISPNDTVTWWNFDLYGFDMEFTFNNSKWYELPNLSRLDIIFNAPPGIYNYHSNWGENGSVIVNLPPTVTITTPANHAVLSAPATFTLQATASDTDDDYISDVEFLLGTNDTTNSIEDVYTTPYSTTVTDLAAGTYTLLAVARDSRGWTTSDSITITVGGGSQTISLTAPRIANGQFLFDIAGLTVGKTNLVQASTNLLAWTAIKTNIAVTASLTYTNTIALPGRFFRVVELP